MAFLAKWHDAIVIRPISVTTATIVSLNGSFYGPTFAAAQQNQWQKIYI